MSVVVELGVVHLTITSLTLSCNNQNIVQIFIFLFPRFVLGEHVYTLIINILCNYIRNMIS